MAATALGLLSILEDVGGPVGQVEERKYDRKCDASDDVNPFGARGKPAEWVLRQCHGTQKTANRLVSSLALRAR